MKRAFGGRVALRSVLAAVSLAILAALLPASAMALPRGGAGHDYIVELRATPASGIRGPAATLDGAAAAASIRGVDRAVRQLERQVGFEARHRYAHALIGFSATLTDAQVARLSRDPQVAGITRSRPVEPAADQVDPTGVRRVHAEPGDPGPPYTPTVDADIAIIDTGVSAGRDDELRFGDGPQSGADCVAVAEENVPTPAWSDVNGHGTHVAGIAAAKDDADGVVGVAPGARIWSVRVFGMIDGPGGVKLRGSTETVICGIDWVTAHADDIEVANMSLVGPGIDQPCGTPGSGGSGALDPQHDAICASVDAGVTYVVAAGNAGTAATFTVPAAYDEVITVSALSDTDGAAGGAGAACSGSDDTLASYSNYGADVDLIAPEFCIKSLHRDPTGGTDDDGLLGMSGTSMASPHVAGAAALYLAGHPSAEPAQVRRVLRAAATLDWDYETDLDDQPDRLLDVARMVGPEDLDAWVTPASQTVPSGPLSRTFLVHLSRGGGLNADVELSVSGLPAGVAAHFGDDHDSGPDELVLSGLAGIDAELTLAVGASAPGGTHAIVVHADGPGATDADATLSLVVDDQAPLITGPGLGFEQGSTLLDGSSRLRLLWAVADAQSGLDHVVLRQRVDGGDWLGVTPPGTLPTTAVRQVQLARDYQYQLRVYDVAGNVAEATTQVVTARLRQSDSSGVAVGPGWFVASNPDASGGSLHRSKVAGSEIVYTFTGRSVAWVGPVGPKQGRARVYVDGVDAGRVDLQASSKASRRLVFVASWATIGPHTLRIVVRGGASAKSVGVDAFLLLGS